MSYQKWKYVRVHIPSGTSQEDETLCEMTPHQFLSALSWWNYGDWRYYPVFGQPGMLSQHQCKNVRDEDYWKTNL